MSTRGWMAWGWCCACVMNVPFHQSYQVVGQEDCRAGGGAPKLDRGPSETKVRRTSPRRTRGTAAWRLKIVEQSRCQSFLALRTAFPTRPARSHWADSGSALPIGVYLASCKWEGQAQRKRPGAVGIGCAPLSGRAVAQG